jgi:acyl carrier protein
MDVENEIRNFILENFLFGNREKLPADGDSFLQKGLIDSTGILEVISFIEEKFGISVKDDELVPENLDSIRCIADFVGRKRGVQV